MDGIATRGILAMSTEGAPLRIWRARLTYLGALPKLDVSASTAAGIGKAFAPSARLVYPFIKRRKELERAELRAKRQKLGGLARLEALNQEAEALWADYEPRYLAEMRISYGMVPNNRRWGEFEAEAWERGVRPNPGAWWSLPSLAAPQGLVLLCWCGPRWARAGQCHAIVLGRLLARLGAIFEGEVPAEEQPAFVGSPRLKKRKCFVVGRDDPSSLDPHEWEAMQRLMATK